MTLSKQLLSSKDQTWGTPRPFFNKLDSIFGFELDPCCEHHTAKCDKHFTKEERFNKALLECKTAKEFIKRREEEGF